jgi:hypothetical protein
MATSAKSRAGSASGVTSKQKKVETPARVFAKPTEVVADPDLSARDKVSALNTLEQDARQMAVASAEGMSGGEETNLREVLQAKRNVELPSAEAAFTVVTASFEKQLQETLGTEAHALISRALEAMRDAREAIARMAETPSPPPGAPKPGSTEELDEELAKEKLDP